MRVLNSGKASDSVRNLRYGSRISQVGGENKCGRVVLNINLIWDFRCERREDILTYENNQSFLLDQISVHLENMLALIRVIQEVFVDH